MINKLDKSEIDDHVSIISDSKEGDPKLLSSNKGGHGSPSLGFDPNSPDISEEFLVDELARLLVECYLEIKSNERKQ